MRRLRIAAAVLTIAALAGGFAGHFAVAAGLKADLVIEDVQVAPSNPTRVRVKAANQGLSPAVESQFKLFYQRGGSVLVRVAVVPLLETGERRWLVIEAGSLLVNAEKVTLQIDEPDQVDESDEGNNLYEFE